MLHESAERHNAGWTLPKITFFGNKNASMKYLNGNLVWSLAQVQKNLSGL